MRNCVFVLSLAVLFLAVTAVGCTRAYIETKDRVDVEVVGNQGVIYGPTPASHKVANPTRDIYTVDFELPTTSSEQKAVSAPSEQAAPAPMYEEPVNVDARPSEPSGPAEPAAVIMPEKVEKIK